MRGRFSFLYVDIWFDLAKCKFIVKNSTYKMLVVLLPIFVADTKITFVYNFVAPLKDHCMLNYFDPKLNTEVICDASPYGLSAILTQCCEDDNK